MVIHTRTAIQLLVTAFTAQVALNVSAKDTDTDSDNQYVDMPPEYYENLRQQEREANLVKGDQKEAPGYVPGYRRSPGLGLSPHAPELAPAAAAGLSPAFGAPIQLRGKKFQFDFHGYVQPTLRMGFGKSVEDENTVHSDPSIPGGAYGWFDSTNTLPTPWAQINFLCGNEIVNATVVAGAWSTVEADEASGTYMGHAQQIFAEAYLTYTPDVKPFGLKINVGAFPDRYGYMAQWHKGAYGASFVGDIYGAGATASFLIPFIHDVDTIIEGGFKGEFDKAPIGIAADGSNEYARSEEGSTFAGHGHIGVHFAEHFTPTFHAIYSWSQDDRGDPPDDPSTPVNDTQMHKDGSLLILAGDLRIDGKRFGYLYAGGSHIVGQYTNSLTDMVQVLNTGSGYFFNERYWGFASNGNGTLTLAGLQYGVSLGTLLRHPMPYWGVGPDLIVNVFGIYGYSSSEASEIGSKHMMKWGAEGIYSFSRYVAASFRFDHVMPNLDNQDESFEVLTPKIILRSDWNGRESLNLQYSYIAEGDETVVRGDNRMMAASDNPDRHMLAIYGTIWW
jgi:hypothetical protein